MAEPETVTLAEPIVITLKAAGGAEREETITELVVQPFKAKDLRSIDGLAGEGSQALALIARMTRQPVKVIDELGGEDFVTLTEKVGRFLPNGRRTGGTD